MDKALVFGTKDCRFESCQGQIDAAASADGRRARRTLPCGPKAPGMMLRRVTAVGFEPTPFRNGALSHRLRPLGQTVLSGGQSDLGKGGSLKSPTRRRGPRV